MAFNRATDPVYAKGTMDVWCWSPATGNLDYYSNKIQTNQFQTSVNLSPVNAGVGNPVVINLPDSSTATLTITAADVSLAARSLSVGGTLSYNGVIPMCESIKATTTSLQVSNLPAAGLLRMRGSITTVLHTRLTRIAASFRTSSLLKTRRTRFATS